MKLGFIKDSALPEGSRQERKYINRHNVTSEKNTLKERHQLPHDLVPGRCAQLQRSGRDGAGKEVGENTQGGGPGAGRGLWLERRGEGRAWQCLRGPAEQVPWGHQALPITHPCCCQHTLCPPYQQLPATNESSHLLRPGSVLPRPAGMSIPHKVLTPQLHL